jgi:hypothetical protein
MIASILGEACRKSTRHRTIYRDACVTVLVHGITRFSRTVKATISATKVRIADSAADTSLDATAAKHREISTIQARFSGKNGCVGNTR